MPSGPRQEAAPSVNTSKPAMCGRVKTGHIGMLETGVV